MAEGEEREWLSDANIIRLLLGVLGAVISIWLYSQDSRISTMAHDVADIRVSVSGVGDMKSEIHELRTQQSIESSDIAALKNQANATDRELDQLVNKQQTNRLEDKYRKKEAQDRMAMELERKHRENEVSALTELVKKKAVGP